MRINACKKGKRGELGGSKLLTRLGFPCERNARNGISTADLLFAPGVLDHVHVEVKHSKSIKLGTAALMKALAQSEAEAAKRPFCFGVVLWFEARRGWRLTFRRYEFGVATVYRHDDIKHSLEKIDGDGCSAAMLAREQCQEMGLPTRDGFITKTETRS